MELIILAAVIVFLVFMALYGRHKGFVNLLMSMLVVIVALMISYAAAPAISAKLVDGNIYRSIHNPIQTYIEEKTDLKQEKAPNEIESKDYNGMISKLKLPKFISEYMQDEVNESNPVSVVTKNFASLLAQTLTVVILNIFVFIILFIIISILLKILIGILDIITKLPVLNFFNKTLGMLLGLLLGIIIIWLLCLVLLAINQTSFGKEIMEAVQANKFLRFLYDQNLLMKYLINLIK